MKRRLLGLGAIIVAIAGLIVAGIELLGSHSDGDGSGAAKARRSGAMKPDEPRAKGRVRAVSSASPAVLSTHRGVTPTVTSAAAGDLIRVRAQAVSQELGALDEWFGKQPAAPLPKDEMERRRERTAYWAKRLD